MFAAHIRDKKIQTCTEHCRNTAEISGKTLSAIGLENTAYLSGLLHDMGKFHEGFNTYLLCVASGGEYKGEKVIHTFTGVSFVLNRYHNGELTRKTAAEVIALAIGSHHGFFDIYHETTNENAFCHRITKQPEYDKVAVSNFMKECATQEELDVLFEKSTEEVESFVVTNMPPLCTKPEARTKYDFYLGLLARLVLSAVVEGDRRDTADFMKNENHRFVSNVNWTGEINFLNRVLDKFPSKAAIQKARRAFSDACCEFAKEPGDIYRLDLPTGGGKTLSGLRYALSHAQIYEKRRIFYVAPLLTILEQNAKVIKSALPDNAEVLLHYSNIAEEEANNDLLDERELLQESWESKIIITTLVQMLQTMFSGKMSSARRFNALSNSVIIFDEVQSLPIKIYSMFNLAVNFLAKCCNTTIVLCSATLPIFDREGDYKMCISSKQMIPQNLLESTKQIFKRTNIKKWTNELKLEEVPGIVVSSLQANDSVLVVCNKKKQAEEVLHSLASEVDVSEVSLFHLSAGMCPRHRKDTLKDLVKALEKDEKVVCISTQVIEAGVDISFDCVFRFAAGLDNVVQSAGRCNRNGKDGNPRDVFILNIADESLKRLKEIQEAKAAILALLDKFAVEKEAFDNELSSIKAVNCYYEKLFARIGKEARNYPDGKTSLLSLLATNSEIADNPVEGRNRAEYTYAQSFKTAGALFKVFDNNQVSVLVPYNDEAKKIIALLWTEHMPLFKKKQLLTKAKDYTVSVFNFEGLQKVGAIDLSPGLAIPCLREEFYDRQIGISNKEVACNSTIIV